MNNFYFMKINGKVEPVPYLYINDAPNESWNAIPANQFLSPNEIAEHQLTLLCEADKDYIKRTPSSNLIRMHHSYGMYIRNTYGLWHPNNPNVIKDDLGNGHPDGLSMIAIERLHQLLQHDPYDHAMSIVQEK